MIKHSRNYPEFIYIDRYGRILGDAVGMSSRPHGNVVMIDGINRPEDVQALAVSAVAAILARRRPQFRLFARRIRRADNWQRRLEQHILLTIPRIPQLKSRRELLARYPTYPYGIKTEAYVPGVTERVK